MKKFGLLLGIILCTGVPPLAASDIAFYVGQWNTDGWYGSEQFDHVNTIIAEAGGFFRDIQQFDDTQFPEFTAWIEANMDDGELDIIWLNGCTPSVLYPNPNQQTDGSPAENWLDHGNMLINVGDWFGYTTYEGGARGADNGANGAANILDLPAGVIASASGTQLTVTPTGQSYLPSLGTGSVKTDRPVVLSNVQAPWEVAAAFATTTGQDSPSATQADPVVIHNTDTDGYLAIINQASGNAAGWIPDRGLTTAEFIKNWVATVVGLGDRGQASRPLPEDQAVDVFRDGALNWSPGVYAVEHDVYLGTNAAEVNDASTADPVYLGRQTDTHLDPGRLALGQTYYWRVDEVNGPPDRTVHPGPVWQFTVEPVAYAVPVTAVTAVASSAMPGSDPAAVANGAGLNAADQHSVDTAQMWLSMAGDTDVSITFTLDRLEKLDHLHVWNHNSQTEGILGFGTKEAQIETSRDGQTWTDLGTVTLDRGTGLPDYAGRDVPLNGVVAQYLRISPLSNWSVLPAITQKGLAEVRFYAVPMRARLETPPSGSGGVAPLLDLAWRPGRGVAEHDVLVGTDPNALSPVDTVSDPTYQASVPLDSTVFWRVDEVNVAGDPTVWPGSLWSFTTNAYLAVDDMESYKSEDGAWVWETWRDGFEDNANGALLGHGGDDMERGIVYDGAQSLPFAYGQNSAPNSEASRPLDGNWGQHGIVSLSLMFFGQTTNTPGTMYLKVNGQRIADYPVPADLTLPQWQAWTVDLPAAVRGPVQELALGFDGGAGLVFIDAIRLYPRAAEPLAPVNPGSDGLMAYYPLDGNANDASGNGYNGTPLNNPLFLNDAARGQVLALDGLGACVDLGTSDAFNFPGSFSLGVWAQIGEFTTNWGHVLIGKRGESNVGWQLRRHSGNPNLTFTLRGTPGLDDPQGTVDVTAFVNEWLHVTAVYDMEGGRRTVYINGLTDVSIADANSVAKATHNTYIGARATGPNTDVEGFFDGLLDEVRIYNRALTQAEALGLAGRQEPIFKPF